jgi:hypothetical protein
VKGQYTEAAVKNYMIHLFDVKRQENLGDLDQNKLDVSAMLETD